MRLSSRGRSLRGRGAAGVRDAASYRLDRPTGTASAARPTAVDLFCGAGGLSLGLAGAGFRLVFASDWNGPCEAAHTRNLPETPFVRADAAALTGADILRRTGLTRGDLDLLAGGPPCQGFSIIGQRDSADPRNSLIREFMRIADELRPKVILIENVPGLATLGGRAALGGVGSAFDRAGYDVQCAELLAAQYGVPQMRWRMIFIGWRRDMERSGGFPPPTHGATGIGDLLPNRTISPQEQDGFLTVRDAIGDLPPVAAGESVARYHAPAATPYQRAMRRGAGVELHNHYAPNLSEANLRRLRALKPGDDWRDLPVEMLPPGMRRALRKDHTRRYSRMEWSCVPRAIITRFRDPKSGEYTHPEQNRTITIREAARIQSFPDWFVFEGGVTDQYEQVGNAVPPLLAKAIGFELIDLLSAGRGERRPHVRSRYRIPIEREFWPATA